MTKGRLGGGGGGGGGGDRNGGGGGGSGGGKKYRNRATFEVEMFLEHTSSDRWWWF